MLPVTGPSGMSGIYFLLGVYVLAGLVFGGLCAQRAVVLGRSPVVWFFAGLFLLGAPWAYLLVLRPDGEPAESGRRQWRTRGSMACELCGAKNHPTARRCLDCGSTLVGSRSEADNV